MSKSSITTANKSDVSIKGHITVEGVQTTYGADGTTVLDQRAVLKMNKGIFSKKFLVPLTLFSADELTQAMVKEGKDFFPENTELKFADVKRVPGRYRTYEGTLTSVLRPVSANTLAMLVASGAIAKDPA